MEDLENRILNQLESRYHLEPLPISEELREIKLPLGYLKLNMRNWRMGKVRKISVMRCTVLLPRLQIFAIEMYPEDDYDVPLLAIDFSKMKKKTFVYMNFIPMFEDDAYFKKYIARLEPIRNRYNIVPEVKPKDWMTPYITKHAVYSMPKNSLLDDARSQSIDYLTCYLDMLDSAEQITDPAHRDLVRASHTTYCNALSEKDGSRRMLGRFIGMKRADRIFKEVIV